jgi:hypothetical protein
MIRTMVPPVTPVFELTQDLAEAHLAEEPPVTGLERDAGPGHGIAEHLLAERTPRRGHVVIDAHADVHGGQDLAGIATGPRGALGDPRPADGDALGRGPVEQRPVSHLAGQPEHLRAERAQVHRGGRQISQPE